MKKLERFDVDLRQSRRELDELRDHLINRSTLKESADVLPFFRQRPHLAAFVGSYFTYISIANYLAFEYDVFGDFRADLVVGDSRSGWYGFVEFENAAPDSIFVDRGSRATSEWSPRFSGGFNQVVDWFWKLSDMESTREFTNRFGKEYAGYEGLLVIGRSEHLDQKERDRLRWRRDRLLVDSKHIHCVTFDELHDHLDTRLSNYESAYQADEELD